MDGLHMEGHLTIYSKYFSCYCSTLLHRKIYIPDGRTEILGSDMFIGTKFLSQLTVGGGSPVAEQDNVASLSLCTLFHVGFSVMRG